MYAKYFKRLFDITLSFISLILLIPIITIIAILVMIKMGRPVIFSQDRPGKNGRIFKMYKFRSMTQKKDTDGNLLDDQLRLTRFGKILRSTSLDELPELWNILKGDMSFVGPRPLLVKYLPLYNDHQKRRHECRPGLTGLAQVNGRNLLQWDEKFNLDVQYVDNISFIGDIKILIATFKKVIIRDGISSEHSITMEEFKG